jgi:hypothetical protein
VNTKYPQIKPETNLMKQTLVDTVLFVLGRAFQSAAKHDSSIKNEVESWDDGFSFMMRVLPDGPKMAMEKRDNQLIFRGSSLNDADLIVNFKNLEAAFLLFTTQLGTADAYAEHRMSVKGDIAIAMSLIRCLNTLEEYLFPKIINNRILKRVSPMTLERHINRVLIYLGVPLGI